MSGARRLPWAVLVPAAKTTRSGGDGGPWRSALVARLAEPRRVVASQLMTAAAEMDESTWSTLVEAKGKEELAEAARTHALDLLDRPTMPAGERYAGPVASNLDAPTIPAARRRHVFFVTATAGLIRADEPMPDERLAVGSTLPALGRLSTWWRPANTSGLEAATSDRAVVYDLLGGEYAQAIDVTSDRIRVEVAFDRDGRAAPSATAKLLRGAVARHVATTGGRKSDVAATLSTLDLDVSGLRWMLADVDEPTSGPRSQLTQRVTVRSVGPA